MIGEFAMAGVFVPALLVMAVVAALVTIGLMRVLARTGFYRLFAYRALVDVCLFVVVLGLLAFLFSLAGYR